MKIQIKSIILIFILFLFSSTGLGTIGVASAGNIEWYNYEQGMSEAKKNGKNIFLHFYANWCRYCTIMEKETFANGSVINYLNKNFVSIKVNTDTQRKIAMKYGVRGLPSNWFVNNSGEKIGNRPGYISPDNMISYLKFIHTESYKDMTLKEFMEE
jgi:thioredoxin-related protein